MEYILTMLYGIIEGITEWLPISSTGHLILLKRFVSLDVFNNTNFWDLFLVIIQLGAILAVIILFFNKLFPFKLENKKLKIDKDIFNMWFKIAFACIPGVLIILFGIDEKCEVLFYNDISVSIALIVVGIVFIIIKNIKKKEKIKDIKEITYKTAFIIGVFQIIAALFPGVSRSGIIIIGALLLGISRTVAAEFAFFLAIPAMLGSSMIKILKYGLNFTQNEFLVLLLGTITAFITSIFIIKFLINYIKKHDFKIFGYYRIILGIVIILLTILM